MVITIQMLSLFLRRKPKAPKWYSSLELREYLQREKYCNEIADQLAVKYAENLQRAFNKGYSLGQRSKS